ncbi:MAG: guanylate kinase [Armatimonadetes bacterium]|nr:guanylate kinase [Armatimonadota bacterium]
MPERHQSIVFVICGPSGVGKTTLVDQLLAHDPQLRFSVSMTTRAPRAGEVEGTDYHFVDEAAFAKAVAAGELLEHAVYNRHRYGTPRAEIERAQRDGFDLVLDIDVQGARQIRDSGAAAVFIFIAPPDFEALAKRLRGRATESEADFQRRLETARQELAERTWFDYEVVNDELETAVAALREIIAAERRRAGA